MRRNWFKVLTLFCLDFIVVASLFSLSTNLELNDTKLYKDNVKVQVIIPYNPELTYKTFIKRKRRGN